MDHIDKIINDILNDEDMPEHMVTKTDDEQMRALLEKHLKPLKNLIIYEYEIQMASRIRRQNRYDTVTGEWLGPDPEPVKTKDIKE